MFETLRERVVQFIGHHRSRDVGPWAVALGLHAVLLAIIISLPPNLMPRGNDPMGEVVRIFVVPPPVAEPEEPEVQAVEDAPPPVEQEVEEAIALSEEEVEQPEAPEAPAPETPSLADIPDTGIALPDVALPDMADGAGTPDGLVALDCYTIFSNRDKALECAGREIRSGWQLSIEELGGEWDRIAEELRRGGHVVPAYGPDRFGDLGPDQRIYRPEDDRFNVTAGPPGGRYNRAFTSAEDAARFRALRDPRRAVGFGDDTVPLSGWQPSWELRDDAYIDQNGVERIIIRDDE